MDEVSPLWAVFLYDMPIFEMPLQHIGVSPLDWVKENTNASSHNQDWKVQQEPVFTTSGQHPPERCASQASTLSNNHDICRICHCEGDSEVPLIAPCYCAGSLRYVHQACLQQWIKSSDIRNCELCKFQFIMQSKIKPFSEVNLYLISFWNEKAGEDAWNMWQWGGWEMLSHGHFWIHIPSACYKIFYCCWFQSVSMLITETTFCWRMMHISQYIYIPFVSTQWLFSFPFPNPFSCQFVFSTNILWHHYLILYDGTTPVWNHHVSQ